MLRRYNCWLLLVLIFGNINVGNLNAHQKIPNSPDHGEVRYLGNEALMVTDKQTKILFDPFFHSHFNTYTLVPQKVRLSLFSNRAPYNNIDAIFISHAHGDHFDAKELLAYLKGNPTVKLVAPKQAIDKLLQLPQSDLIKTQTSAVELKRGDKAIEFLLGKIRVEAVRIPHSGWPQRAEVENIVFRLTLNDRLSVIHMGDADADDSHFSPYKDFWLKRTTDMAFPPYWFLMSAQGKKILNSRINADKSVGIHVPNNVPPRLKQTGEDFFSIPEEIRLIKH